jgi:hypothetical protein
LGIAPAKEVRRGWKCGESTTRAAGRETFFDDRVFRRWEVSEDEERERFGERSAGLPEWCSCSAAAEEAVEGRGVAT